MDKTLKDQREVVQVFIEEVKEKNSAKSKLENAIPVEGGAGIPPLNNPPAV